MFRLTVHLFLEEPLARNANGVSVYLHDAPDEDTQHVGLQQRSLQAHPAHRRSRFLSLPRFLVILAALLVVVVAPSPSRVVVLLSVAPLLLPPHRVHGVAHVHQAGRGNEHDLQHLARSMRRDLGSLKMVYIFRGLDSPRRTVANINSLKRHQIIRFQI